MSVFSDINRAMRPSGMEEWETRALREALSHMLRQPKLDPECRVEVPGVTKAGRAYLLTCLVRNRRIARFEVDHDPDLSAPVFDAYIDKRAEWEAEKKAKAATGEQEGGDS